MDNYLFLRAMRKIAMLAWIFDECREGQIPRTLGRFKFDAPLLAAGYLTSMRILKSYKMGLGA